MKGNLTYPATHIEAPTHYLPAFKTKDETYLVDFNRAIPVEEVVAAERERIAQSFDREAEWRESNHQDEARIFRAWAREIREGGSIASEGSVVPTDADDLVADDPAQED